MIKWIKKWNLIRFFRLLMGLLIIFQGLDTKESWIVGVGVVFSILPSFNIGCCGTSSCEISSKSKYQKNQVIKL